MLASDKKNSFELESGVLHLVRFVNNHIYWTGIIKVA